MAKKVKVKSKNMQKLFEQYQIPIMVAIIAVGFMVLHSMLSPPEPVKKQEKSSFSDSFSSILIIGCFGAMFYYYQQHVKNVNVTQSTPTTQADNSDQHRLYLQKLEEISDVVSDTKKSVSENLDNIVTAIKNSNDMKQNPATTVNFSAQPQP